MPLPDPPGKNNTDETSDDPKQALLVDLQGAIDTLTALLAHLESSAVTANPLQVGTLEGQLALLDAGGKWPASMIPSQNIESATTGDGKLTLKTVPDDGWIMADDGTIGSATSGATNRANADCEALFKLLWNNIANAYAPVVGGRGISAQADWNANKRIQVGTNLGRAICIAGNGSGLTARALGQVLGAEQKVLSLANMRAHDHDGARLTQSNVGNIGGFDSDFNPSGNDFRVISLSGQSQGSSSAFSIQGPRTFWNIMIKL